MEYTIISRSKHRIWSGTISRYSYSTLYVIRNNTTGKVFQKESGWFAIWKKQVIAKGGKINEA